MVGEIAGPASQAQLLSLQALQGQSSNTQARAAQVDQQIQDNQVQTANSDIGQGLETSQDFSSDNQSFSSSENFDLNDSSATFDSSLERGSLIDEVV